MLETQTCNNQGCQSGAEKELSKSGSLPWSADSESQCLLLYIYIYLYLYVFYIINIERTVGPGYCSSSYAVVLSPSYLTVSMLTLCSILFCICLLGNVLAVLASASTQSICPHASLQGCTGKWGSQAIGE